MVFNEYSSISQLNATLINYKVICIQYAQRGSLYDINVLISRIKTNANNHYYARSGASSQGVNYGAWLCNDGYNDGFNLMSMYLIVDVDHIDYGITAKLYSICGMYCNISLDCVDITDEIIDKAV